MEKYRFSKTDTRSNNQEPIKRSSGHGHCEIYDCPMEGHIHTSNWNCRYHHGKSGDSLVRITKVLRNNESLFLWHGKLLQSSIVDFDVGDIAKRAPYGLNVRPGETYSDYKARMFKHIEEILK